MLRLRAAVAIVVALLAAGCTADQAPVRRSPAPAATGPTATTAAPSTPSSPTTTAPVAAFDSAAAMATVRELAAGGPREATSAAYRRAADVVEQRFIDLGYDVNRQSFQVPAGVSWGIPVEAGGTSNVVARPAGLDPGEPHVVLGAHLDTVPQAPGAEDNASGVAVLLELARLAVAAPPEMPVVFVAFGAEEPRGPGDDEHHFGSQTYLRRSGAAESGRTAMISLDRVGAPGSVPVCTGGLSPRRVQHQLLAAAERTGVPARACDNRTSDHWPFEKAGEPVARVGGNDSPGYHSARDLPRTVSVRQLDRVGSVLWEWLTTK